MPSLLELQRGFRRALLNGDAAAIAGLIAGDGMDAADRLDVYRNNVFGSLTSALKSTFPAVCRLVDERFFAFAAHEFIRAHPLENPSLVHYGADFPRFLARFEPARGLAYLPDVARLEWLLHKSAEAVEAKALPAEALRGIAAEDTPLLRFRLQPSYFYLESPWPIDLVWRANRPNAPNDETVDLDAGAARIEIARRAGIAGLRDLSRALFAFRRALADGETLGRATETALTHEPGFELHVALADLFRDGAAIGFSLDREVPR